MASVTTFNSPSLKHDFVTSMENLQKKLNCFFEEQHFPRNLSLFASEKDRFMPVADVTANYRGI
jgi:hypothetical protein